MTSLHLSGIAVPITYLHTEISKAEAEAKSCEIDAIQERRDRKTQIDEFKRSFESDAAIVRKEVEALSDIERRLREDQLAETAIIQPKSDNSDELHEVLTTKRSELECLIDQSESEIDSQDSEVTAQKKVAASAFAGAGKRYGVDNSFVLPDVAPEFESNGVMTYFDESDAKPIVDAVAWAITVFSGIAAGYCLGVGVEIFHPDTMLRDWIKVALCALFGLATSTSAKYALESLYQEVSRRVYAKENCKATAAVAVLLTVLLVTVYSTIERRGLIATYKATKEMENVRSDSTSNTSSPSTPDERAEKRKLDAEDEMQVRFAAVFGGFFLTGPYVVMLSGVGWRKGRYVIHSAMAQTTECVNSIETLFFNYYSAFGALVDCSLQTSVGGLMYTHFGTSGCFGALFIKRSGRTAYCRSSATWRLAISSCALP